MMHYLRAIVGNLRSLLSYAVVTAVDDTGGAQMASLRTGDGANRADVEVMQPFGFGSVPPVDGATTLVLAVGGDPGNLVALALSNPSTRFGGLKVGEAVLYGGDGTRVHIRQGGAVEIWTKTHTINADTTTINGDVQVNGGLTATGDVADGHGSLDRLRGHYNEHTHADDGGAPPTPKTPNS